MEDHASYFAPMNTDLREYQKLIQSALSEAKSGDDLACVALLIVGADLRDDYGQQLRDKIMERVKAINASNDQAAALIHARGIGAAMRLLSGSA